MALFEYRCKDCGKLSEHLVFSADDKPACTTCGSANLEKLLSPFAVNAKQSSSPAPVGGCPNAGCCGGSCGLG
jgi:putative FmdB family regulatory protein